MLTSEVKVQNVVIGGEHPLACVAGPCVIETEEATMNAAKRLKDISHELNVPIIFKSSYDKANRTALDSYRGPGPEKGLMILERVKKETSLPVISDVHSVTEVPRAAQVLDMLQIPAFLCRQTDLIIAAAETGKPVNIKKGQFLAPADIKNIIDKVLSTGNRNITVTERGVSFGYNNLVVDMRAIPIMQGFGFPVLFDATHSVQLPGGQGIRSGGQSEFVKPLARAAVAAGCSGIFLEIHECPDKALCDGPNMLSFDEARRIIRELLDINRLVRRYDREGSSTS
ncbi:MAG: 3-deoxy-8-phosphooctulonate synthase [Nitrospiraceae bacterium]|nr:MAG: 3-deoxy-8-phosphooctulonate synthase [Nitrospiraceae bacterium]